MSGTSGCLGTRRGVSGITAFDSCLPTASIYIVADSKQLEGVRAVAVRTDTAASLVEEVFRFGRALRVAVARSDDRLELAPALVGDYIDRCPFCSNKLVDGN